ncbi:ABC transporter substrate-binding protein [Corynebacterium phoceense]|uniref:ABC transporter substrate-binding protein n=1 Tax=Corynebacterium phoceense TaxID=1686286 RepID=UPI00211C3D92|nr:ABC transporter substrate-binding protein [Corynebacterium phoceense]MCQ9336578.1 ABC transporter substrate-binding protein [Corynebacterium phoceense]
MKKSLIALFAASAVTLAGCGSSENLEGSGDSDAIVVGSQDYYSNEIVAAAYAQALEDAGYTVDRQFRIGQREVYMSEVESGNVDVFPEYTGPLLQYWVKDAPQRSSEDVYAALSDAAPEGLKILDQAGATDQDAYAVTKEFAEKYNLTTGEDLKNVTEPLTLGANSEAENRPNGPKGLKKAYDVDAGFTPIEDSGGPLTVKALKDGQINIAIVYTADPSIEANGLKIVEDNKELFLASHLVPVANKDLDEGAQDVINKVSDALTMDALLEMNARSVNDQVPAETIAKEWVETLDL